MSRIRSFLFAAFWAVAPLAAEAAPRQADLPITTAALAAGETRPPIGYVGFCMRYAAECARPSEARAIKLDQASWALLNAVNNEVNRRIKPITDKDHWGVAERWDYPTDGQGDCEDYALLKRKMLIEKGIPSGALLLTVVIDREDAGHAVLTAVTDRGDFILDNQEAPILSWIETGYRFVKRQSMHDPNLWSTIGTTQRDPVATAAR